MSLREEDRAILVELELEKTDKILTELEVMLQNKLWSLAANRMYYALFHAVSALLINGGHEIGTHRGAVNRFSHFYVKAGLFAPEDGRLYSQLQGLREDGDYNCAIDIQQDEVEQKLPATRKLIDKIKLYLANNHPTPTTYHPTPTT